MAEDNPVNQQVAAGLLRRRGHTVDIVGDGRAAVAAAAAGTYDVVLMDVHMPTLDGIEATREIRRLVGDRGRVPIIALSASAMPEETARCLAAGMNDHLTKPLDPVKLAAVLARHAGGPLAQTPAPLAPVGLDMAYLDLLVDSLGAEKVRHLIIELPSHTRPHGEGLRAARTARDLPAARVAAHALHGIAANLGLTGLAEVTARLEEACLTGAVDAALPLCEQAVAALDDTLRRLRDLPLVAG